MKHYSTKPFKTAIVAVLLWLPLLSMPSMTQAADTDISQPQLDQLLAPVALFPDTVLSHVLIAATYPLEVVMAHRWIEDHPKLKGDTAINAAEAEGWDPSVTALVAFPDLLKRMSADLEWTQQLGEAFLADEERVLASVQQLRQRALESGHLQDMDNLTVEREDNYIVIEPRVRQYVYLPWYDTRVVYGNWWWTDWPPYYWDVGVHRHHGWVYWGPRVSIHTGFWFSAFNWHYHSIVVHPVHRHQYYSRYDLIHRRQGERWNHAVRHRRSVAYRHTTSDLLRNYEKERVSYIRGERNTGSIREQMERKQAAHRTDSNASRNSRDKASVNSERRKNDVRAHQSKDRDTVMERGNRTQPGNERAKPDKSHSEKSRSEQRATDIRSYLSKDRHSDIGKNDKGRDGASVKYSREQRPAGSSESEKSNRSYSPKRDAVRSIEKPAARGVRPDNGQVTSQSKPTGRIYHREVNPRSSSSSRGTNRSEQSSRSSRSSDSGARSNGRGDRARSER